MTEFSNVQTGKKLQYIYEKSRYIAIYRELVLNIYIILKRVCLMKVKSNYLSKSKVTYVTENMSISEARYTIIQSGYRCIPVLDEKEEKFVGLLFKETTSDYIIDNVGSVKENVSRVVEEKDAFIHENTAYFKVLFSIRRLPFMAVVDDDHNFLGIITHSKVMDILQDSYGIKNGGYSLTVSTTEGKGSLRKLFTAIHEEYNIEGVFTQDAGKQFLRRVVITFNKSVTRKEIDELIHRVEANGFKVADIEDLRTFAKV
jgi:CBS domain-containing protein